MRVAMIIPWTSVGRWSHVAVAISLVYECKIYECKIILEILGLWVCDYKETDILIFRDNISYATLLMQHFSCKVSHARFLMQDFSCKISHKLWYDILNSQDRKLTFWDFETRQPIRPYYTYISSALVMITYMITCLRGWNPDSFQIFSENIILRDGGSDRNPILDQYLYVVKTLYFWSVFMISSTCMISSTLSILYRILLVRCRVIVLWYQVRVCDIK